MPLRYSRLLIALRVHAYPEYVLDTVDSIFHYSTTAPIVTLAIDRGPNNDTNLQDQIEALVTKHYPQVGVYRAKQQWGWGAGMYGLLCCALEWARKNYDFEHFLSLDYDAPFVRAGADQALLDSASEPKAGLVGTKNVIGKTWAQLFKSKWPEIMEMTGGKQPPKGWEKDCVYGAVMLLTKPCVERMLELGYMDGAFRNTKHTIRISDDPWTVFLVRLAGFRVIDNHRYCYNVWQYPEGIGKMLKSNPELRIFHPVKMQAGGRPTKKNVETANRNWLRKRRGKKPLGVK